MQFVSHNLPNGKFCTEYETKWLIIPYRELCKSPSPLEDLHNYKVILHDYKVYTVQIFPRKVTSPAPSSQT
jgi:hypothetical protein